MICYIQISNHQLLAAKAELRIWIFLGSGNRDSVFEPDTEVRMCGCLSAEGLPPVCQSEVSCSESPPALWVFQPLEVRADLCILVQD